MDIIRGFLAAASLKLEAFRLVLPGCLGIIRGFLAAASLQQLQFHPDGTANGLSSAAFSPRPH